VRSSIQPHSSDRGIGIGARCVGAATTFSVWAPDHRLVEVVIGGGSEAHSSDIRPLARDDRGYWSGTVDDAPAGTLYRFRLNRSNDQIFPDPASRYQPSGVHGPSEVVDASTFQWTDAAWRAPALDRLVIYELHVGTFTPQGTFDAAADRLDYLTRLGVNAIELMPLADFAGNHNWGYDGVAPFAPARCYGTPDSLRALVDRAHRLGLAVIVDAVYNHFGPDGAYAIAFSPYYLSDVHTSPWGRSINFDGAHAAEVRRFFIESALQWVLDYHADGLRLDATHAIVDDSTPHFLAELTSAVRAEAGRDVLFIAEDHRNLSLLMKPARAGGFGLDAVWADDFHHQARVHTAGDRDGYYADYSGSIDDLATTLRQGWFYTGQVSAHLGGPRGTDPSPLEPPRFVLCIQNHDQVGNRIDGARLHHQIGAAAYRALSVLLLTSPYTPLLFMGQEWAATSPFQFFTDHHDELGRLVTEGRRAEFASFQAFNVERPAPDPQLRDTFERSKLQWSEREASDHAGVLRLYERLLRLRRDHPALQEPARDRFDVSVLDRHTLSLRRSSAGGDELRIIARLSGEGASRVSVEGTIGDVLLTTEDRELVESPRAIRVDRATSIVELERPGAMVITSTRSSGRR
jgi:maltooligosyltrehalose trehalohydrolase